MSDILSKEMKWNLIALYKKCCLKYTASATEQIESKADILKDIYKKRKYSTNDFGLAEPANNKDFLDKLKS